MFVTTLRCEHFQIRYLARTNDSGAVLLHGAPSSRVFSCVLSVRNLSGIPMIPEHFRFLFEWDEQTGERTDERTEDRTAQPGPPRAGEFSAREGAPPLHSN